MVMRTTFVQVSTEKQIEMVESLAKEIWTEHYTPIIGREQVCYMLGRFQTKEAISDEIGAGVLYFLIRAGGELIGYVAVQPKRAELFLSKLYIRSANRSSGYGRKAVQFIEGLARKKGLGKILLTVNRNNTGSLKAYEKLGFRNLGSVIKNIGGGFVMDDYRMEKNVSRLPGAEL